MDSGGNKIKNKIKDKGTVCQRMKTSKRETEEDRPTLTKPVI